MTTKTLSMAEKAFWNTDSKEVSEMQSLMDSIAPSLSDEQLQNLNKVIEWCSQEAVCDNDYDNRK